MDNTPIIEPSSSLAISNGTAATNAAATANPGTTAAAKTAVPPTSNPSSAAIGKTAAATSAKPGGAALAKWNGAMFANPVSWPTAKLYGAQAAKISGEKLVAGGLMIKLLMVLAVIPVGAIVAGIWLAKGRKSEVPVRVNRRKPKRKSLMRRLFAGRVALICLTLITVGMLSIGGFLIYKRVKVYNISIAAGDAKGESFVLMKALQTVAGRYYPHINITVSETGGTTENLRRIERGDAQFATAQADVPAGPTARSVAVLYEDNFQLLAHGKADGAKHEGTPAKGEAAVAAIARFDQNADFIDKHIPDLKL